MITYKNIQTVNVYIDGKLAGQIKHSDKGYQYIPSHRKTGGEYFKTIAAVKKSLEA